LHVSGFERTSLLRRQTQYLVAKSKLIAAALSMFARTQGTDCTLGSHTVAFVLKLLGDLDWGVKNANEDQHSSNG